ncbi:MAG: archaeoflavoprotein AfpA [Thermoleophilia bacterium]|nr:archaeoflavoprotein AfpA [Thermoleophilia bacterium]
MTLKVVWGITGSGDLMPETVAAMAKVRETQDVEITALLSKEAVKVIRWYKLWEEVERISRKVIIEEDANTPFIVGPMQIGRFDCFLVAPATANTTAKVAHGIADTIITNAVAQVGKTDIPIMMLPVDQRSGTTVTTRPGGEKLTLRIRAIDVENAERVRKIEGLDVLGGVDEIADVLRACPRRPRTQR